MAFKNTTPLEVVQGHVRFLKRNESNLQNVLSKEGNANWRTWKIYDKLEKLIEGMTEEEFQAMTKED